MPDDGAPRREGRQTRRGFGTLPVKERADAAAGALAKAAPVSGAAAPARSPEVDTPPDTAQKLLSSREPPIEVEWVEEEGPPRLLDGHWRAYEVWTAQHIYVLRDDLSCLEVIDRATGRAEPHNEIVGARLIGGEIRDRRGMIRRVFHPLPHRGARAVFTKAVGERQRMSETSPVTRVVLRQRVVSLMSVEDDVAVSWKEITGRHELP
jgi:hypothetical protein